jgi:hypothetical protein
MWVVLQQPRVRRLFQPFIHNFRSYLHQHFALLVLKTFFKTDYRGVVQMLVDFRELREDLGLDKPPHYSTLCKAEQRLLKKGRSFSSSSRRRCAPKTAA